MNFTIFAAGLLVLSLAPTLAAPTNKPSNTPSSTATRPGTVSSTVPAAQYGPWRSSRIGGGGYIQNVVMTHNPRVLYAYVDVGGMYRSDDGGSRWRMLHGALPAAPGAYEVRGLSPDPRDENSVLALIGSPWSAGGGVWKSPNGGKSWRQVLGAPFMGNGEDRWTGFLIARDPKNPARVIVASEKNGLWQSSDGGSTWSKLGQPDLLENLHPTDLKISADGKRLWLCARPYKGWLEGREVELKGGFFSSNDAGATWRKMADEAPIEMALAPWDKSPDGSLVGIFEQKSFKQSRDGGATWSEFGQGLPQLAAGESLSSLDERAFQSLASGPDFWVTASTKGTFYKRGKSDTSWQPVKRESATEKYEGEPWVSKMEPGKFQHFGAALASITIDPRDANRWFFTDWFAIYQSRDAGRNWNLSMDGVEVTVLHTLAQDAGDAGVVHLGMADNGYMWSENGGVRFHTPHQQANMKGIALSPLLPSRVYGVGDPGNGQWKSNTVWVSIDRGRSWHAAPSKGLPDREKFNRNSIAVDPRDPMRVFVSMAGEVKPGEGGVYESRDGGTNWKWIGEGLPTGTFFTSDIWSIGRELQVLGDGTLVAASRDKGAVYFRRANSPKWEKSTTDIGGPWHLFASPDNSVWASCQSRGVWQSTDGGATWTQKSTLDARHIAVDLARPTRVALGVADGVRLSEDGGATWKTVGAELPHKIYPYVAFAGERLIAGSSGSGAFWMPLSPRGEAPVVARPVQIATLPGDVLPTISFRNGNMEEGAAEPEGWELWRGEGAISFAHDVAQKHGGAASLRLEAKGGYGSASQVLGAVPPGAGLRVRGWVRIEPGAGGVIEESLLAVRGTNAKNEQSDWQTIVTLKDIASGAWTSFDKTISLSPSTTGATLTLTLRGSGRVWLDEVSVEPSPRVFLP